MSVIAYVQGNVGVLTLNRPQVLNVLDLEMVRELTHHLNKWAHEPEIHTVILRGAGDRAFCAGGDVRTLYWQYKNEMPAVEQFFDEEYALDCLIHRYPKPTIALMDGVVMGGGMGLGQGCTYRLVTEGTRMAMPETAIGLFPDVGSSYFLSRIPLPMARYVGMVGDTLSGVDAVTIGLADLLVPSALLDDLPGIVSLISGKHWLSNSVLDLAVPSLLNPSVIRKIEHHFGFDGVNLVHASLTEARLSEDCEWTERTVERLKKNSPLMVHVTFKQLTQGRSLSLEACFKMERLMMRHCFRHGDVIEGVRSFFIEKEKPPSWKHPSLINVDVNEVDAFFA